MPAESLDRPRVQLCGVGFDAMTEREVTEHVLAELDAGRGGRIVTPNVDILRRAVREDEARQHVSAASIVVADGTPLVWAARLAGTRLPARVPGSDLIWSISAALAEQGRSIYLLGGEPGTSALAARRLAELHPTLTIAGHASPSIGFDQRPDEYTAACDEVVSAKPDVVFVGLGFPKQERVIHRLRAELPETWFMGCGAAIGFVGGVHPRAPRWMQRSGLEWLHRLGREPGRLARRYVMHDAPFAARLLASSLAARRLAGRGTAIPAQVRRSDGPGPVPPGAPALPTQRLQDAVGHPDAGAS